MEHKRKRSSTSIHTSLVPLLQRIKVFIMSNSAPVRTRRSNTVNGRIKTNDEEEKHKHPLRKYKSYTDISSSSNSNNFDTQQSWSQVTKLYTLCLEPLDGPQHPVSPKYMKKDFYENWWSQTPTLQSMA